MLAKLVGQLMRLVLCTAHLGGRMCLEDYTDVIPNSVRHRSPLSFPRDRKRTHALPLECICDLGIAALRLDPDSSTLSE